MSFEIVTKYEKESAEVDLGQKRLDMERKKIENESAEADLSQKRLETEKTKVEITAKVIEMIDQLSKSELRQEEKEVIVHNLVTHLEIVANTSYPTMVRTCQTETALPPAQTPETLSGPFSKFVWG
ncbi:MAG: hypothetical protein HZB51_09135 [Chloroflexi bacterium]|nr:hypothetical protein [Chloroflexota bacterium]